MSDNTLFEGKLKVFFQEEPLHLWVWQRRDGNPGARRQAD